ncbi:MAG: hypothetical protein KDD02_11955 [Phaeodactylibacter sp.]|nr:hypothetical protein [Phaeodactylibacter sp.]MCB9303200.1 hypothetical protein [Lewinellaceae bacterium]HQU58008.1 hypothetical protein [Saprospiraceae bacterium]
MAYTTVQNLTTIDRFSGEIKNGDGFCKAGHTFFYWEDIEKVIRQSNTAPISNLELVGVRFTRKDGGENHDLEFISVLALRKTEEEMKMLNGNFNNEEKDKSQWHNIVALAWPPYYIRGSVETLENDVEGSPFAGRLFEGSSSYMPGIEIGK